MDFISVGKAILYLVLSIFIIIWLALPKAAFGMVALPIGYELTASGKIVPKLSTPPELQHVQVEKITTGKAVTDPGKPPGGDPQPKFWVLVIVVIICIVVAAIIIKGIIDMTKHIPNPQPQNPPPNPPPQPPAQQVPSGPITIAAKNLDTKSLTNKPRYVVYANVTNVWDTDVSARQWKDTFGPTTNTYLFTNVWFLTLQSKSGDSPWSNRVNFVYYQSTSGGIMEVGFNETNSPVSSVYYRNQSYMNPTNNGGFGGYPIKLEPKQSEMFRFMAPANFPGTNPGN